MTKEVLLSEPKSQVLKSFIANERPKVSTLTPKVESTDVYIGDLVVGGGGAAESTSSFL